MLLIFYKIFLLSIISRGLLLHYRQFLVVWSLVELYFLGLLHYLLECRISLTSTVICWRCRISASSVICWRCRIPFPPLLFAGGVVFLVSPLFAGGVVFLGLLHYFVHLFSFLLLVSFALLVSFVLLAS